MKVGVGKRGIPTDNNVIADAQFQFAQQDCIAEIAVIADLDTPGLPKRKMNTIHSTVFADNQCGVSLGTEALKCVFAFQYRAATELHVGRQFTLEPLACGRGLGVRHVHDRFRSSLCFRTAPGIRLKSRSNRLGITGLQLTHARIDFSARYQLFM